MRSPAAVCALIGFALAAPPVSVALAQNDVAMARGRAPQFFIAPARSPQRPVPVDVASVPVLRRRVSLDLQNVSRSDALDAISRASGLRLVYAHNVVLGTDRVRLKAEDITVAAALTEVLLDAGVDVVLAQSGDAVLVKRTAVRAPAVGQIVGRVTDSAGRRVPGVEMFLDGTRWRTETDSAGSYRLADVDTGTYTLRARKFGYAKYGRRVTVREGRVDTADVVLAPMAAKLDELVTTATGRQRRWELGNDITTIRADSVMQHARIRNLTDLLDHRVPGLTVQHTSGAPGDPAKLRLRGLGSAFRSNDPVVIVDGIRIYSAQSEARSGNLTNPLSGQLFPPNGAAPISAARSAVPAPSPLDQIDMNTVETVEIFNGPSAATLYGADAANGVIVITTKRGKPGPTTWTGSLTYGRDEQPGRWPTGYYLWGHDSALAFSSVCRVTDPRCVRDSLVQFQALNVPSLTVLGRGHEGTLSLTASGGSQALLYSVTGSYNDVTGWLKLPAFEAARFRGLHNREPDDWMQRPHHYKIWSVTSTVTANLSRAATVTLLSTLSRSEQQRTSLEQQFAGLMTTYIDTLNGRYWTGSQLGAFDQTANVLSGYYTRTTASTITVRTGLNASWTPRSWLRASGTAALDIVPRNDETFLPAQLLAETDSGTVVHSTGRSLVSTLGVQGELRKPLGHGFVFTTSLGANQTTNTENDVGSRGIGLVPGTSSLNGATRVFAFDQKQSTSVFGWYIEPRIAGERLSLSTGLRLDGGSAYGTRITGSGSGAGGGFLRGLLALPRLNGSWIVSEEPWFPLKTLFSSVRLRGAYGQAQVQPGPLDRLRIYSRTPVTVTDPALLTLTGVGNTHLKPERSTEFEGGVDADLLDSRLSVELTAYRKVQIDALMPLTLPGSVNGGGSVMTNVGNITNSGLGLKLGFTPVRSPALQWRSQLTFNRNRNILTKLGKGVAQSAEQGLVEGYPVRSRWALPILGFADANHDGILQRSEIQVGDSAVYMGRLEPAYTSALSTDITLFGGALGLSAMVTYDAGMTQQNDLANNAVLSRALSDPSAPPSELAAIVASQPLNGLWGVEQRGTAYGLMQEVSTLRFQSLSVNYRAPQAVARLLGAEELSVALQGNNLGLHSNYRGKDPDVNAWSPGEAVVDTGLLPQPRTWRLAFYLKY